MKCLPYLKRHGKGEQAGRAEGRAEEIIAAGYEFGLSEKTILERLQKKNLQ